MLQAQNHLLSIQPGLDVDIQKINSELADFQNKCRKLPKALKD